MRAGRFPRGFAILLLLVSTVLTTHAAPDSDLWPRWQDHEASSTIEVDHSAFGAFLSKYLVTDHPSGVHLVRYDSVSSEDRNALAEYLSMLQGTRVSDLNRDEQKAYWINLYNAFTLALILDNLPVSSITKIKAGGGLFTFGPWDAKLLSIEGEKLSLNDIEHRILRPIWQDNRIHYAVNCASIGCPNLQPEPFSAGNTEALLDRAARDYINHPRGVRFEGNRLFVSSIFDWYKSDFGGSDGTLLAHLAEYAEPEIGSRLLAYRGRIRDSYDWDLNAAN